MGLTTVTITIEEFKDLVRCKRKLIEIRKLKDDNAMAIRETNKIAKRAIIDGDMETVVNLVSEQDKKNLIYMAKIIEVLESEDE